MDLLQERVHPEWRNLALIIAKAQQQIHQQCVGEFVSRMTQYQSGVRLLSGKEDPHTPQLELLHQQETCADAIVSEALASTHASFIDELVRLVNTLMVDCEAVVDTLSDGILTQVYRPSGSTTLIQEQEILNSPVCFSTTTGV